MSAIYLMKYPMVLSSFNLLIQYVLFRLTLFQNESRIILYNFFNLLKSAFFLYGFGLIAGVYAILSIYGALFSSPESVAKNMYLILLGQYVFCVQFKEAIINNRYKNFVKQHTKHPFFSFVYENVISHLISPFSILSMLFLGVFILNHTGSSMDDINIFITLIYLQLVVNFLSLYKETCAVFFLLAMMFLLDCQGAFFLLCAFVLSMISILMPNVRFKKNVKMNHPIKFWFVFWSNRPEMMKMSCMGSFAILFLIEYLSLHFMKDISALQFFIGSFLIYTSTSHLLNLDKVQYPFHLYLKSLEDSQDSQWKYLYQYLFITLLFLIYGVIASFSWLSLSQYLVSLFIFYSMVSSRKRHLYPIYWIAFYLLFCLYFIFA